MAVSVSLIDAAVFFVIGLVISSIIIFLTTKLLGETEGFDTALPTALVGAIIYALAYYFLGHGLVAALIGGFVWLLAIGGFYNMSWLKAFGVAVIVWVAAALVGIVLPTVVGPL